ncbi:MAG TPA: FeoB-associated Cys-rich membrane protein [Clostridiales bacterium]|nr:FeoB-associated Cys-rich membrane protein [Clostridiales bacterium]
MGTIIVGIAVLAIVGLIIRGMVQKKKQGKSIQCGCNCGDCSGSCHHD